MVIGKERVAQVLDALGVERIVAIGVFARFANQPTIFQDMQMVRDGLRRDVQALGQFLPIHWALFLDEQRQDADAHGVANRAAKEHQTAGLLGILSRACLPHGLLVGRLPIVGSCIFRVALALVGVVGQRSLSNVERRLRFFWHALCLSRCLSYDQTINWLYDSGLAALLSRAANKTIRLRP